MPIWLGSHGDSRGGDNPFLRRAHNHTIFSQKLSSIRGGHCENSFAGSS